MIKQIITLLAICLSTSVYAQYCVPDTSLKKPGYKPDSLPPATVNMAYKQTITVQSFKDTYKMVFTQKIPVTIDSIIVTGIKNLPAGMQYQCLHPNCRFLPLVNSCVDLKGTPTQTGIFPLKIMVTVYAKLNGSTAITQKDSITKFRLIVNGTSNVSKLSAAPGDELVVYPNPVQNLLHVFANWSQNPDEINIYDVSGRLIQIKPLLINDVFVYDLSLFPAGVYFVKYAAKSVKFTKY